VHALSADAAHTHCTHTTHTTMPALPHTTAHLYYTHGISLTRRAIGCGHSRLAARYNAIAPTRLYRILQPAIYAAVRSAPFSVVAIVRVGVGVGWLTLTPGAVQPLLAASAIFRLQRINAYALLWQNSGAFSERVTAVWRVHLRNAAL